MKYIVFPSEKLDEIPQEMLDDLHLTPRKSVDGTQAVSYTHLTLPTTPYV